MCYNTFVKENYYQNNNRAQIFVFISHISGKDAAWVDDQIYEAIKGVYLNKLPQLRNALQKYAHKT